MSFTPLRSSPTFPKSDGFTKLSELDGAVEALEVQVLWRDEPLHIAHLSPARPFVLGVGPDADFRMDREAIGYDKLTLPVADATYEHGGLRFVARRVLAGRAVGRGAPGIDWRAHRWTAASVAVHGLLLGLMSLTPPSASALSLQRLSDNSRYGAFLQVKPTAELEPVEWISDGSSAEGGGATPGGDPEPAGSRGGPEARRAPRRPAAKRPAKPRAPRPFPAPVNPRDVGIVRLLGTLGVATGKTRSVYTAHAASNDSVTALASLLRGEVGDSGGAGGLDMIGTGRGSRSLALGTVGVGGLGTGPLGNGSCVGPTCAGRGDGQGPGFGTHDGGLRRHRSRVPPRVRVARVSVRGSLSKETIRRVIGRQLGKVRYCYEQGLVRRPDLDGRVAVRFLIAPSGAVQKAFVTDSSLQDAAVERCVARVVERLAFPEPGGIVSVTYPFVMQRAGR